MISFFFLFLGRKIEYIRTDGRLVNIILAVVARVGIRGDCGPRSRFRTKYFAIIGRQLAIERTNDGRPFIFGLIDSALPRWCECRRQRQFQRRLKLHSFGVFVFERTPGICEQRALRAAISCSHVIRFLLCEQYLIDREVIFFATFGCSHGSKRSLQGVLRIRASPWNIWVCSIMQVSQCVLHYSCVLPVIIFDVDRLCI